MINVSTGDPCLEKIRSSGTQEVFLRLWNDPEKFDAQRGSLRSSLLANTHGHSIDLIRAESARRTREDKDARLNVDPGQNIEEEVWEMALSDTIKKALSTLGASERRPLELAYFGGHTHQEVAEMPGQPEGTVKSWIRAGMKRLQASLDAAGVGNS